MHLLWIMISRTEDRFYCSVYAQICMHQSHIKCESDAVKVDQWLIFFVYKYGACTRINRVFVCERCSKIVEHVLHFTSSDQIAEYIKLFRFVSLWTYFVILLDLLDKSASVAQRARAVGAAVQWVWLTSLAGRGFVSHPCQHVKSGFCMLWD